MRDEGLFLRLSAIGATAQASVPGLYAWGVTVAPTAWARGASGLAKVAAVVALSMLVAGVVGERRWAGRYRSLSFWGFVVACAVSWSASPSGLSPLRIDASRGLAGLLGWALFAFASAAPPLRVVDGAISGAASVRTASDDLSLNSRRARSPGHGAYLVGAALLAAILQIVGWSAIGAERALLVRSIALAAGLAVVGAATEIALARHARRSVSPTAVRFRRALLAFVALSVLALVGLLNALLY